MLAIVGTPWAHRYLSPEDRSAIEAMVPPSVVKVSLTAGRAPGDWSARLFVDESRRADPRGISRGCRTLVSAVSAAVLDMALGAPLAWCSTCPEPAVYQRNGEAWCHACETNRGGTIS